MQIIWKLLDLSGSSKKISLGMLQHGLNRTQPTYHNQMIVTSSNLVTDHAFEKEQIIVFPTLLKQLRGIGERTAFRIHLDISPAGDCCQVL